MTVLTRTEKANCNFDPCSEDCTILDRDLVKLREQGLSCTEICGQCRRRNQVSSSADTTGRYTALQDYISSRP